MCSDPSRGEKDREQKKKRAPRTLQGLSFVNTGTGTRKSEAAGQASPEKIWISSQSWVVMMQDEEP